jgi:hypothetical protein
VIKILHTEPFLPLGKAIPKPAPAAPKSVEIKPGIWQAPDGKLRTDFATGQSVAPAQKAAPVAPLPVLPNALGIGCRIEVVSESYFSCSQYAVGDTGTIVAPHHQGWAVQFDPSPSVCHEARSLDTGEEEVHGRWIVKADEVKLIP